MKPTNIKMFPCAERYKQAREGTSPKSRYNLQKLREELGLEPADNIVDLAAVREERLMNILGN